jgi:carbon-monoxide dehydrogenase large subunit
MPSVAASLKRADDPRLLAGRERYVDDLLLPRSYDDGGQLVTGTLMDYPVPRADNLPLFEVHYLETPAPAIPGGFRGAGEAGTTGAPAAILNAVNDALVPFGATITEQSITAECVLRALRPSRDRQAGELA